MLLYTTQHNELAVARIVFLKWNFSESIHRSELTVILCNDTMPFSVLTVDIRALIPIMRQATTCSLVAKHTQHNVLRMFVFLFVPKTVPIFFFLQFLHTYTRIETPPMVILSHIS